MTNSRLHKWLVYGGGAITLAWAVTVAVVTYTGKVLPGAFHLLAAVVVAGLLFADRVLAKRAEGDRALRSAMTGRLKPAPREPPKRVTPLALPALAMGDSEAVLAYGGAPGLPLLTFTDGNGLTVGLDDDGQVRVSVLIRGEDGRVVAELVNNEWKVAPSLAYDRNYSPSALEVLDASKNVVLQVRLAGNRVRLAAKLRDSSGAGFAIGSSTGPDGQIGGVMEPRPPGRPFTLHIAPIFRYPSDLHLGELAR